MKITEYMTGILLNMSATHDTHDHEDHGHEEHGHEEHVDSPTPEVSGADAHVHGGNGDFGTELLALLTDPAHLAFEFIFSLVFDLLIVTVLYGIVIQKYLIPRLRKSIHEEIDREHGLDHDGHKKDSSTGDKE